MRLLLKNASVWQNGQFERLSLVIDNGRIAGRSAEWTGGDDGFDRVFALDGLVLFPGFTDVHVHLREPGFSYKETIGTGSLACARGGYTTVCAMPNLQPAPDTPEHLREEEDLIRAQAAIRVLPYASITMGQKGEGDVVDMAALAPRVCGFSDDGRGVKTAATMREAMEKCAAAGSIIAAHCEDVSLIPPGGCIHDGAYAKAHGLPGIPSESEWAPIARDIELCRETGCAYHVCHVSCQESLALIRQAKAEGVNITCETAPHYLLLSEEDLPEDAEAPDSGRFKMNPPLRRKADQDALLEAVADGTVDMIATDHAPHAAEEKAKGLRGSAMGIVGIETAFPLLYTYLVETGRLPLSRLIELLAEKPRQCFGLDGGIAPGDRAELCVWDLHADSTVDPSQFVSKGHATPFTGWPVHAVCRLTISGDRIAWEALT